MLPVTEQELLDAVEDLKHDQHTYQKMQKLAAVYTVLDHMYPDGQPDASYGVGYGYSRDHTPAQQDAGQVGLYGDSEFLRAIAGRDTQEMWRLMDEVMTVLAMSNKRLYNHVMDRL